MATAAILGAGEIGGALARQLAAIDVVSRIVIVDDLAGVAAGKALDDPDLKLEGDIQEAKGDTQKAVGKGKEALKDTIDKL